MNTDVARFNMIEQQIRPWNVLDPQVLKSLSLLPREKFVPAAYQALAFADVEIPLADTATARSSGLMMLPPRLDARLVQSGDIKPSDKVLEVGTGSGYMAALLATQAAQVISVELVAEQAARARQNLAAAGIGNVQVEVGDGLPGWAAQAPYDVIVLSGGVSHVPQELLKQLRPGGRLIAMVGDESLMQVQRISCASTGVFSSTNLFETAAPMLKCAQAESTFEF